MTTITKTYKETDANPSGAKSTWTLVLSGSNVTASGETVALPVTTLTAKYSAYSGKNYGNCIVEGELRTPNGNVLAGTSAQIVGSWAGNTNKSANMAKSVSTVNTASLFSASNKNAKTLNVSYYAVDGQGHSGKGSLYDAPEGIVIFGRGLWGTLYTITLNAPPTFDSTQVYFDTPYVYAGYTTASVDVSNISAKYGGDISSVSFTIGNQTVTGSGNGTLSIALTAGGTFTPTVKVTDSRGQVTTKTLDVITVNTYVAPSASFTVERTDSLGVPNDEGESAVITATFNYTDDVANLTTPTIVVRDQDNTAVTPTITWYTNRELTTVISSWSSVASGATVYALLDNANHDLFNTQKSYQIALTPNDTGDSGTAITQILGSAFYTVDFLAGGHGIAFGQACTDEGFWCAMSVYLALDCDGTASSDATSGEDMDLFNSIRALGWYNDVII